MEYQLEQETVDLLIKASLLFAETGHPEEMKEFVASAVKGLSNPDTGWTEERMREFLRLTIEQGDLPCTCELCDKCKKAQ